MWNTKEMSQQDAALAGVRFTLNFQGQILSREWGARLSRNEGDGSQYDALVWNTKDMSQQDAVLTGVPWTFTVDQNRQGQIASWE